METHEQYIILIFLIHLSQHYQNIFFYEKLAFIILISCEEKYSGKKSLKKNTRNYIYFCRKNSLIRKS